MMKNAFRGVLGLAAAAFVLSACNAEVKTSVVGGASDAAVSAPLASAPQGMPAGWQEVKTADGAVSLNLPDGFVDQAEQAGQLVSDVAAADLLLLQRHEAQDIIVYVAKAGAPKQSAEAYFTKLTETVKAATGLQNVAVDTPADNRLTYRFSREENDSSLYESCVALYSNQQIYTACAASSSANMAELDAVVNGTVLAAQ